MKPISRTNTEQGTALLVVMVLSIVVMGVIMAIAVLAQSSAESSTHRVDYARSLEVPEIGTHRVLQEVQKGAVELYMDATLGPHNLVQNAKGEYREYLGFVGQQLDAGSPDTRTVFGSVDDLDYIITVRSAYWAHYDENSLLTDKDNPPASFEPASGSTFLGLVPKYMRDDPKEDLFDYYHIRANLTKFQRDGADQIIVDADGMPVEEDRSDDESLRGVGRHAFRRGVDAIMKIHKLDIMEPTSLYIDEDEDPNWVGAAWQVSGADHDMRAPQEECPDCKAPPGPGMVMKEEVACPDCGGDGKVPIKCTGCNGSGRTVINCPTCGNTGNASVDCTDCTGFGRVWKSNSAPATGCAECNDTGTYTNNGGKVFACKTCQACVSCAGTGQVNQACPDCDACATCAGAGSTSDTCKTCGGTGGGSGALVAQICETCEGDGNVPSGTKPTPGFEEEAYRVKGSTDNKPGIGYPGEYDDLSALMEKDGTQVITSTDTGDTIGGEDATIQTKMDLRLIASMFTGGNPTSPLTPDPDRVDNSSVGSLPNGSGAGPNGLGDQDNFYITYVQDGVDLKPNTSIIGGGVLIIDGPAKFAGNFEWYGMIIVLGSLEVTGNVRTFGSVMGADTTYTGDPADSDESKVGGSSQIWWCQEAYDNVMKMMPTFVTYPTTTVWRSPDKADIEAVETGVLP